MSKNKFSFVKTKSPNKKRRLCQDRIYFTHFRKKTGDQPKLYIWARASAKGIRKWLLSASNRQSKAEKVPYAFLSCMMLDVFFFFFRVLSQGRRPSCTENVFPISQHRPQGEEGGEPNGWHSPSPATWISRTWTRTARGGPDRRGRRRV